ncbi:hypothetical protein EYF80_058948 [Liparis tanakae]|uniref:Uncharacterized protein n=1 Tax=Liparis tanakae TaxID=230148 RepID=A0A4Z2EQK6_9TELE|nr:hypothetical protein EYF80_058948 [Liparis tanakae]
MSAILTPDRASAISCRARSLSCFLRSASRSCRSREEPTSKRVGSKTRAVVLVKTQPERRK